MCCRASFAFIFFNLSVIVHLTTTSLPCDLWSVKVPDYRNKIISDKIYHYSYDFAHNFANS